MFRFCIISLLVTAGFVAPSGDSWLVHEIYRPLGDVE